MSMASTTGLTESWLSVRRGRAPVIVFAPHGGRRSRGRRPGDSVNDLHTAELARELAERLDASALINRELDRNDVDLNRISHLTGRTPQVLRLLRDLVESAAAMHGRALVLSVHGWNVSAPWCDIGIGLVERLGKLEGAYPTISAQALTGLVEPLMQRFADCGLTATLGHRYPASGRDNAMQLFSGRHRDHDEPVISRLAELGEAGRAGAIQLELGIPLRWPGRRREVMLETLVETLGVYLDEAAPAEPIAGSAPARAPHRTGGAPVRSARPRPGCSVQAVLDDGGGLFFGAEHTAPEAVTARLCIARPDGTMVLFVGEARASQVCRDYHVAGFTMNVADRDDERTPERIDLSYAGPLVRYPTHDAFVDLEAGLAGADLCEASVELHFERAGETGGRIRGSVVIDGVAASVCAAAVCERGSRWGARSRCRSKVYVIGDGTPAVLIAVGDEASAAAHLRFHADAGQTRIELDDERGRPLLRGAVTVDIPVYRELPEGRRACIRFGVARIDASGPAPAFALFERFEVIEVGTEAIGMDSGGEPG